MKLLGGGANLFPKKPTLSQLSQQNRNKEGPEAEKEAPEGGVGLVADEEAGGQRGSCDILLLHSWSTEIVDERRAIAGVGAVNKISTGIVDPTNRIPCKDLFRNGIKNYREKSYIISPQHKEHTYSYK